MELWIYVLRDLIIASTVYNSCMCIHSPSVIYELFMKMFSTDFECIKGTAYSVISSLNFWNLTLHLSFTSGCYYFLHFRDHFPKIRSIIITETPILLRNAGTARSLISVMRTNISPWFTCSTSTVALEPSLNLAMACTVASSGTILKNIVTENPG